MEYLFAEFCSQAGFSKYGLTDKDLEGQRHEYDKDFDYNDGEEGANGIVRYFIKDELVAIRTIHGGDSEDVVFTEQGKILLMKEAISCFVEALNKIETDAPEVEGEQPYILGEPEIEIQRKYNPKYGDDRICECGHTYYRHFDSYEKMYPCGCKYCECGNFKEKK